MEADQSEIKETSQTLDRGLAPSWSLPWAVVLTMLAFVAIAFLSYWSIMNNTYVADDWGLLTQSVYIPASELWRLFLAQSPIFIRPIPFFNVWFFYQLSGLNPMPSHLLNVGMHAINACLLIWLLGRIGMSRLSGYLAAILFLVTPIGAESVGWTRGRFDVWALFFILLTLGFYATYLQKSGQRYYLAALFTTVSAWLSKEPAMILVILIPTLELLFLIEPSNDRSNGSVWKSLRVNLKPVCIRLSILFLMFAAYIGMRYAINGRLGGVSYVPLFGAPHLKATASTILALLAPLDRLEVSKYIILLLAAYVGTLYALSLGLVFLRWKRASMASRRAWLFLASFFIVSLAPIYYYVFMTGLSSYLSNSRMYYISYVPFISLLVIGLFEFGWKKRAWRICMSVCLLALVPIFIWGLNQNNKVWERAALINNQINLDTQEQLPDPPEGAKLYFKNVPRLEGAHIFALALPEAMHIIYGRRDLEVYYVNPDPALKIPDMEAESSDGYLFEYDWGTGRLSLLHDPPARP